jgi:hypothetical protein
MEIEISSRKVLRESESSYKIDVDLYLPDNPLKRLGYLTKFSNTEFPPSPFSEKQGKIFKEARKWEWRNKRTMTGCLVVCTVLAVAQVILQLKPVQNWANSSDKNSSMIFSIGAVISVFGVVIGYVATGNIPDKFSEASDKETRDFDRVEKIYTDIAFRLLDREDAVEIAQILDVEKIQASMQPLISKEDAEEICEPLKTAKETVIQGKVNEYASYLFHMKLDLIKRQSLNSSTLQALDG